MSPEPARRVKLLGVVLTLGVAAPARLAADLDDFTLTRAIPADAFMAAHRRGHAGRAFLDQQYRRVWSAVRQARFDRDLHRLLRRAAVQGGQDVEQFEANWQQMMELLAGVEWSSLWQRELAYAEKLGMPGLLEAVALFKPPPDKIAQDFEGLSALLKTLASFAPETLVLTEDRQDQTVIYRLAVRDSPLPMQLTLARHRDTLLAGFGATMVEQSLALLQGQAGTTLASTPRFRQAFGSLPPPQDALAFVDVAKLMNQLRSLLRGVQQMIPAPPPPPATRPGVPPVEGAARPRSLGLQSLELLNKLVDELDLWEYYAQVASTRGMRTTSRSLTVLRADARTRPLYQAFFGAGTLSAPLKYVPKAANDVSITAGVDWLALYREALAFIAREFPGGQQQIAAWNAMQEQWGLNVEQDILGWIQGGITRFSVPGPTPYSRAQTAFLLRVRDEQKARQMIDRALAAIEPRLAQQGGAVSDADIAGARGFRSLVLPVLALFGFNPTIGVADGWLFAATGPEIVTRSLAAAAGQAESFAANELFLSEGLKPADDVIALSFTDLTKLGERTGDMLKLIPAVIRFFLAQQGAPAPEGLNSLLAILSKLGRIAPEFNFFRSTCAQSTFDGTTIATERLTTYRQPPRPAPATRPAPPQLPPSAGGRRR